MMRDERMRKSREEISAMLERSNETLARSREALAGAAHARGGFPYRELGIQVARVPVKGESR
jgi:hypothetical protein